MRLKTEYALIGREGEEKIVRKFLWSPLYFDKEKEKRWLETADVVYKIENVDIGEYFREEVPMWRKNRFATDEDYKSLPFEKTYEDWEDRCRKLFAKPSFWLCLDIIVFLVISVDMANGIMLLLTLKMIQGFLLYIFYATKD